MAASAERYDSWLFDEPAEGAEDLTRELVHGWCHLFSLALHETYGWSLALFLDAATSEVCHSVAIRADGALVDAGGVTSAEELVRRYRRAGHMVAVTPEAVAGLIDPDEEELEEALRLLGLLAADGRFELPLEK